MLNSLPLRVVGKKIYLGGKKKQSRDLQQQTPQQRETSFLRVAEEGLTTLASFDNDLTNVK
jgi:hypothetical protein